MRLLETSSRLATSAMRVPAKPRSITTSHVVSRISLRRSATVGFSLLQTLSLCRAPRIRIEDPFQPGRVISDRELFEDPEPLLGRPIRRRVGPSHTDCTWMF